MDIQVIATMKPDEDGVSREVSLYQEDINDVYELLDFFTDLCNSIGYTYVDRVGYSNDKGVQTWSTF